MAVPAPVRRWAWLVAITIVAACSAALILAGGVVQSRAASTAAGPAAAQRGYSSKLSYTETAHGSQRGSSTIGIQGHGSFSAKLGAGAASEAAMLAMATGVPLTKIAQGGSYKVARQISGSGVVTGTAVAGFRARGLGTVCVSYTEKPGKYVPGASSVPMSGAIKTLGGTGQGATWRLDVSFKQTSLTGSDVESFGAVGSERAGTAKAKPMTAACKRVAKLRG